MLDPALVLGAAVLEAGIGYSDRLQARISHPVTWIGAMITALETRWNRPDLPRKILGVVTLVVVTGLAASVGWIIQHLLLKIMSMGGVLIVLIATAGLAQRSLYEHVTAVLRPLEIGDFAAARVALAKIVGRDVQSLDEAGIAAAALETLAESFADGIVAPVTWLFVGGLAGLFAYKAINTADSLIGHREPRWKDFGWASARTDDVVNLVPARLAGALIVIAAGRGGRVMMADAHKHASPNAGWPEAAMAGALDVHLGGPASYDGVAHDRAVFGQGRRADVADLRRGLRIYVSACGLMWLTLGVGAVLWPR